MTEATGAAPTAPAEGEEVFERARRELAGDRFRKHPLRLLALELCEAGELWRAFAKKTVDETGTTSAQLDAAGKQMTEAAGLLNATGAQRDAFAALAARGAAWRAVAMKFLPPIVAQAIEAEV